MSCTHSQPEQWKLANPDDVLGRVGANVIEGMDNAVDAVLAWNKTALVDAAMHTAKTNPCEAGYMADGAGKCTVCDFTLAMVPGCNACVLPGTCSGCGAGYKFVAANVPPDALVSGTCICDTAHLADPNCALCTVAGSCDECYSGYFPDPATKVCTRCADDCRVCDSATTCNVCAEVWAFCVTCTSKRGDVLRTHPLSLSFTVNGAQ